MATFPERLEEVLRDKKLSRRAIAREASVTPAAVTKWLRGTMPRKHTLMALCARLRISYQWMTDGSGKRDVTGLDVGVNSLPALAEYLRESTSLRQELRQSVRRYRALAAEHAGIAARCNQQADAFEAELAARLSDAAEKFKAQNVSAKKGLQNTYGRVFLPSVEPPATITALVVQLKKAARELGSQKRLSKALGVSPQQLNDWLSGRVIPGGEATLRLSNWIGKRGDNKKGDPESARTLSGRPIQRKSSLHEKTTSDQKRASHKRRKKTTP